MRFIKPLNEKKPKGAPDFHHSDAPDAEGRFKDLGIKDLAAWLIKTRKKDVKKISGSLTQQIVFNRNDDPKYAEKMEKVRKEVYKQLGRQDLIDKMDESYNEFFYLEFKKWAHKNRAKINRMGNDEKIEYLENNYHSQFGKKHWKDDDLTDVGVELHDQLVKDRIIKESIDGLDNAKSRLEDVYQHLGVEYGQTRRGDKYVQINHIPVSRPQSQQPEWVKVFYDNDKDLKKISKELGMDLKESVLNEEDSYNDYPAAAKKNAQMAIDWKEKYGRDEVPAGTPVGWARAHQLAKGEKISADTVKRMSAFNRHRKNSKISPEHKDEPWKDNGYVAWLIWGGDEGVDWAIEKSKEIDAMKESKQMKYIKPLNERAKHTSTDFSKPGNEGDIYFSKREGEAVGVRLGDKLQMIYVFQKEPKLGRIQKSDKRWENMGPASEELLIDLRGREDGKILFKFVSTLEESERKFKRGDKIEYKQLFGMGSKQDWVVLTGVVMKVKNKKKSPLGTLAPHQELTLKSGAVVSPYNNHKDIKLAEGNELNEGYWSGYDYDKWTKANGKPKYPKWVKVTLKEIVKGGFMEDHYNAEHMYMVLWLGSFDNQRRSELSAYDKKGIKEFGKVGYKLVRDKWNDLTGYNMFFMMGAMYALEVSKQIQDRIANGESVEPAYYMMKEYFNSFGMDTKRSRIFNAAYEKLEKWMKDNQIKTL